MFSHFSRHVRLLYHHYSKNNTQKFSVPSQENSHARTPNQPPPAKDPEKKVLLYIYIYSISSTLSTKMRVLVKLRINHLKKKKTWLFLRYCTLLKKFRSNFRPGTFNHHGLHTVVEASNSGGHLQLTSPTWRVGEKGKRPSKILGPLQLRKMILLHYGSGHCAFNKTKYL